MPSHYGSKRKNSPPKRKTKQSKAEVDSGIPFEE